MVSWWSKEDQGGQLTKKKKKKKYKPFVRLDQRGVKTEKGRKYGGNISAPRAVMD